MKRFQDKVIIVTGASSGLGAATALRLAADEAGRGAGGMGWSNTNEGKVIAAAFLDAHNHLVEQVRVLAAKPLPEPVRTSAKAK